MASGRVTNSKTLRVAFTPAPNIEQWVTAIKAAALAAGWPTEGERADPPSIAGGSNGLRFCSLEELGEIGGGDTVIINPGPQVALAFLQRTAADREEMLRAVTQCGWVYARASKLVEDGAIVVDGALASISLPGLGEVRLQQGPYLARSDGDGLMAIYNSLPPAANASALWPADAYRYPVGRPGSEVESGRPDMDLTGRGRILVHGPYMPLTPGLWTLTVRVLARVPAAAQRLRFEWGVELDTEVLDTDLTRSGIYEINLSRVWASNGEAQLRIWTRQPHFQGYLEVLETTIARTELDAAADPHPPL